MFLTPPKAGSVSGDENFISGRKLPWTRAHTLPTVSWATAQPPPGPAEQPPGPAEQPPALSHVREGTGVTVFK